MTAPEMKRIRENLDLTLRELGAKLEMTASPLSAYEREVRKIPRWLELAIERLVEIES